MDSIGSNITTIGELGTHIIYIRGAIEDINKRQSNQDNLIRRLQNNCNREERWEMIREDVKELKESIAAIKSRIDAIEKILESHTTRQSTVWEVFKESFNIFWVAAVAIIASIVGAYLAWRWK
ncbi:MAG TPA: hypothetical protein VN429_10485 [Methanospirillum sp.]|uniref:hypothetical protein n=1 Tax=Methanospirillum sp. TaxID=45200 RepID=UPI002C4771B7|nr:hypothetical protein [Methanospirillum sp.]HWQ64832.1 hypothetical protein [Methanospirillum sp.]